MKIRHLFILLLILTTSAAAVVRKTSQVFLLGETEIRVNFYENTVSGGRSITFFAPHYNEQTALTLAKEFIGKSGGRLIEIESFDERGNAARYLKFKLNAKTYSIDPNRIFTANGRTCANLAGELSTTVENFSEALLKTILSDNKTLREGEKFIVAVHNNADVDAKPENAKSGDLTATSFSNWLNLGHGAFADQADGVFLSNVETDADNFIFLSTPTFLSHFAERGFSVVVQKAPLKLESKLCTVDDGSLSVYSAQNALPYICLEADGVNGYARQRQMFEAVYALLQPSSNTNETASIAAVK